MRFKVGDRVRIKSLDWYNENKNEYGEVICKESVFVKSMSRYCDSILTIENKTEDCYWVKETVFNWTDEMIEGLVEGESLSQEEFAEQWSKFDINEAYNKILEEKALKQYEVPTVAIKIWDLPEGCQFVDENGNVINATRIVLEKKTDKYNTKVDMGEVSDGYHTFNELYEYRMLYNAALFNEFAKQGLYDVHKSRKHSDGEHPFGDPNWFIVMAELPTGQISNHYEMKDWDKFQIPEKPLANKWDEHSPRDVADRLTSFTNPKKEYPKTYEECCKIMDIDTGFLLTSYDLDFWKGHLLTSLQKLLICRDAYWKIAGDEMGLGKPWKPNDSSGYCTYAILRHTGHIRKSRPCADSALLEFPTEEMRDAFYENFKELIESVKELL